MSLRLAIAASLFEMVDEAGRQSKRKHSFADDRHKTKRQHVSDTQRSKRKHSGADGRHDEKKQRVSSTVEEQSTRASRLASRLTRIEAEMNYARTHMSQEEFMRLHPVEIDDEIDADHVRDDKRQRTKIDRREPNGKRDTEQASLINTNTAPKKAANKAWDS